MKNRINFVMYVLSVLVYGYLIYPSLKWLFAISPEQREILVGGSSNSITYISIAIVVFGLLSIVVLGAQLLKKIDLNKWSDWGVKVLMINVVIEIVTFVIIFVAVTYKFVSIETSGDTLLSIANYNMYLNMILQVVATLLIIAGGVVGYKSRK